MFSQVMLTFRCYPDFYQGFIQGFRKIAAPPTSILKTSSLTDSSTSMTQIVVEYGGVDDGAITSMLKTSSSTDSSASAAQFVVESDGVDASGGGDSKSVKKSSKSRELSKSPKNLKSL